MSWPWRDLVVLTFLVPARRRGDCERERRADVRVSRIVGDPRITLLIVGQCQGLLTGCTLLEGDAAAGAATAVNGLSESRCRLAVPAWPHSFRSFCCMGGRAGSARNWR